MGEIEHIHFRESLKSREELLKYLRKFAGDVSYPASLRQKATDFFCRLESFEYKISLVRNNTLRNAKVDRVLDTVYSTASEILQELVASEKGDSEFASVLSAVQDNVRSEEVPVSSELPVEWDSRWDFLQYLKKITPGKPYPQSVIERLKPLYAELEKYPLLVLRRENVLADKWFVNKHYDKLDQLIVQVRRQLLEDGYGDSELANVLQVVHQNVKHKG